MTKPLTAAAVAKYRPGPIRRRVRDGGTPSLFLVIEPSGHKSWQMRFRRPNGKPGKLTLGPLDISGKELEGEPKIGMPLTLAAARQLAAAVHRERAMGHDPIADRKAAKHRRRIEIESRDANTFAATVRSYVAEHARHTRKGRETARLLGLRYEVGNELEVIKGGLVERWADRSVREIDEHDIWYVIDETRRIGVPGLTVRNSGISEPRARMLFVALSSLFSWLRRNRRVDGNPCAGVPRPAKAEERDRVLSNAEIIWFWKACDTVGEPFGALLKLLLVTGCRLREVAGMARSELNDDWTVWNLPSNRTKNKKPHTLLLPPLARELIASVKGKADSNLIFSTTGVTPVSGWSRMKRRLDKAMLAVARKEKHDEFIEPWRLHDLRRTAATGMAEIGIAPHIVEAVLNHISGAKASVAGVYNRAAYATEKKAALETWGRHLMSLLAPRPENIVSLPRRRKQ